MSSLQRNRPANYGLNQIARPLSRNPSPPDKHSASQIAAGMLLKIELFAPHWRCIHAYCSREAAFYAPEPSRDIDIASVDDRYQSRYATPSSEHMLPLWSGDRHEKDEHHWSIDGGSNSMRSSYLRSSIPRQRLVIGPRQRRRPGGTAANTRECCRCPPPGGAALRGGSHLPPLLRHRL